MMSATHPLKIPCGRSVCPRAAWRNGWRRTHGSPGGRKG